MINFIKSLFKKPKNSLCECEVDCGAHIYYTKTGMGKVWCPTVKERLVRPFRQYPWNQVGVNGRVLETSDDGTWVLKEQGLVIDRSSK